MKRETHFLFVPGFVVALALLVSVAGSDAYRIVRMQETADWVAHTHEVQASLNGLLLKVEEVVASERDYVLTGDLATLSSFQKILQAVPDQQRQLKELLEDAEHKASFTTLELLISERLALAQGIVGLRQNSGFEVARERVASNEVKAVMERIHGQFARMDSRQQTLLTQRSTQAARETNTTRRLTMAGAILGFGLLTMVFGLALRANWMRRRAQDQLDRFFTLSLDMLCIAHADGYFKRISPAFTKTLNWTVDEILARPFIELVHPDDRAATLREVERQIAAGESVLEFENRYRHKDGSWRVLSWKSAPQPGGYMFATARDVTRQRQAEADVAKLNEGLHLRTAQLEAANHELESFSYSVSHDLRAPLRHVMGFVDLLQKDAGTSLSEKSLRHLKTIADAAKRMGLLIDDLLAFSRIGKAAMRKTEVDIDQLVWETLDDFQAETKDRNIAWEIQLLPKVHADRALLRLVLINLISNAAKFTRNRVDPKIEIGQVIGHSRSAKKPSTSASEEAADNSEIVIFIRDNGAGFDPRYADKLFGVFQRLHAQHEFEGTGVGLASVQRIIHRHGGRTWAEGVLDGGATFYFSIPKQQQEINDHGNQKNQKHSTG